MDDFRVKIGFLDHPKTVKLRRRLGSESVECFLRLWEYCSISGNDRTNGDLRGLSNEDIAIASKWQNDHDKFVETLADVGFLDKKGKGWAIHQWREHNPYATGHKARSKSAQKAVHARWVKNQRYHQTTDWCDDDCLISEYEEHTERIRPVSDRDTQLGEGNTPTPSPLPLPSPVAGSTTTSKRKDDRSADVLVVFDRYRVHHPRAHPKPKSNGNEWKKIKARFSDGYTVDDLCKAVDGCHVSPFHQGENDRGKKYDSLELIVRDSSHVNQFIELADTAGAPVLNERERRGVRAGQNFLARRERERDEKGQ